MFCCKTEEISLSIIDLSSFIHTMDDDDDKKRYKGIILNCSTNWVILCYHFDYKLRKRKKYFSYLEDKTSHLFLGLIWMKES